MDQAETLARAAYDAYGDVTDHKNYQGLPMPAFDDLSDTIKQAWASAASRVVADAAVARVGMWLEAFDARQQKEIEFARVYAEQFSHGTTGHNQLLIIAKFADLLDRLAGAA